MVVGVGTWLELPLATTDTTGAYLKYSIMKLYP